MKNILITGGYQYLCQAIVFFTSIITSRLLLPEYFGLVGLITVFSGFISIFADNGLSYAIIRSNYSATYSRALNIIACLLGVILFLLTALAAYPIAAIYENPALIWPTVVIGFLFIPKALGIVPGALLQKRMAFQQTGLGTLWYTITVVALTIGFALLELQHWAIILPQIVGSFVQYAWLRSKAAFGFELVSAKQLFASLRITRSLIQSLAGFNVVNYWARNADNLLVGKLYGSHDLGIYARAYSMLTIPMGMLTGLFSAVLLPTLAEAKRESNQYQVEYYRALKAISLLSFPISLVLITGPQWFVRILWGEQWMLVADLLPYFGILILSQTLVSTVGNVLVLEGKEMVLMYFGWICALLMVIAIVLGALNSLLATAVYYSFCYLLIIFGLTIAWIFMYVLKHNSRYILGFWLPKYLLSGALCVSVYFEWRAVVYGTLLLYLIHVIENSRSEIFLFLKVSFFAIKSRLKQGS